MSCGSEDLQEFVENKKYAAYLSSTALSNFITAISSWLEDKILEEMRRSPVYALMGDESTDVATKEEFAICGRYIRPGSGEVVEAFLKILQPKRCDAVTLTRKIEEFIDSKGLERPKMKSMGFDGAPVMSGRHTGVQKRLRCTVSPHANYVNCRAHSFNLACFQAAQKVAVVKKAYSLLGQIRKLFYYSPKKANQLQEIQSALNHPTLKIVKPSSTRWLSHERAILVVRKNIVPLVATMEHLYTNDNDVEAYGINRHMKTYDFIATVFMLSDVHPQLAILNNGLQSKKMDISQASAAVFYISIYIRTNNRAKLLHTCIYMYSAQFTHEPQQL